MRVAMTYFYNFKQECHAEATAKKVGNQTGLHFRVFIYVCMYIHFNCHKMKRK